LRWRSVPPHPAIPREIVADNATVNMRWRSILSHPAVPREIVADNATVNMRQLLHLINIRRNSNNQ
jgi:hypothetical protein